MSLSPSSFRTVAFAFGLFAFLALPAKAEMPAQTAQTQASDISDPFEYVNRGVFEFNRFLDEIALKPLAAWYGLLPDRAREGTHNFVGNLKTPWTAVNDLAQGEPSRFGNTFARFFINTFLGFFGAFDPAAQMGFPAHEEDAGQTFATWGVGEGPYIMLPVFGPSNLRDTVGFAVDSFLDPVNYIARHNDAQWVGPTRSAVGGVDARHRNWQQIEDLQRQSTDFYATIRRVYTERRRAAIANRAGGDAIPVPRMTDAEDAPVSAPRAEIPR
ncbi:MAG: VacJ family lipoprotein [Azospirillum sp.]|nr:VacJ family lipoprotein [Azospirillum sp.]MCA3266061.1 VacJ family lipoprotein [Azospirillum sp.]